MGITLPAPVRRYFDASNSHDVEGAVAPFGETATVRDEGHVHTGHAAIRGWIEQTVRRYRPTAAVTDASVEGATVCVTATVSGTFPGSPVALRFVFTIAGDRIVHLEIGA